MPIIKSEYIRRKLSYIKSIVEDDTKQKLYDINTSAEYIFMQILNDVYGWSLINANEEKPNFPAIDLIDTVNETVFQVTSNTSPDKVRKETIEKFNELVKQDEYKKYANYKIKMFYIKDKPNFSKKVLEEFASKGVPKSYLYGIKDINTKVSSNPTIATKVFKTLCEILHDRVCDYDTPPSLTTKSSTHDSSFIGREDEVKAINEMLESSNSLLLINGIGGIGKSSLANHYLYTREKEFDYYGFIDGLDSFISEFRNSLDLKAQKQDELYHEIISKLQGLQGKKLLVIDNVEDIEFHKNLIEMLLSLHKYDYKILFTSRRKIKNVKSYPLGTLLPVDAQKLFLNCFKKEERAKLDKSKVNKIIDYLGLHTLFIKLVAETIKNEGYSLDNIIEKFEDENGGLSKIDYIDEESGDEVTFNQNLKELFSMQNLKDEYVLLLKRLSVLPSIDIELSFLEEILGKERLQGRLNFLVARGWLIENEGSYKLHQIIKEFVLVNHILLYKEIEEIVEYFVQFSHTEYIQNISYFDNNILYFHALINSLNRYSYSNKQLILLYAGLGSSYLYLGSYTEALDAYSKSKDIAKKLLLSSDHLLAEIYSNIAQVYSTLSEYELSLSFYRKALQIDIKLFGTSSFEVGVILNNLAILYKEHGLYKKALPLYVRALKNNKQIKDKNIAMVSAIHSNMSQLYKEVALYKKALYHAKKSIEFREQFFGLSHASTANSYNNCAEVFRESGEYYDAMPLYKKALKINEKILGTLHIETATNYNNIAMTYEGMENYEKALPLYKKALKIRETILGLNHPDTGTSYHNLGMCYCLLGSNNKALNYVEIDLRITKNTLGKNHINTMATYNSLGLINSSLGDNKMAIYYFEEAVKIGKNILDKNHPKLLLSEESLKFMIKESNIEKLTINPAKKVGRNEICPCNSGIKYKKCCGKPK